LSKSIGAALEIDLVRELASGNPVAGVTWYAVNQMNAKHAQEHPATSKQEVIWKNK